MALNCHRPIFPAHIAEDNLVSPMRIVDGCLVEGIPERHGGEGFERSLGGVNREIEDCYNFGRDRVYDYGSSDSASNEAEDYLPDDPFDMYTSFTDAFTNMFGKFGVDYRMCGMSSCAQTSNCGSHGVVTDFGSICNNASSSKSPANTPSFNQSAGDINCDSPHCIGSACNKATMFGNFGVDYRMCGMSSCAQTSNCGDYGVVADFGSICNNASSSKSPANTPSFNQSAGDINCDSPHCIGSACNKATISWSDKETLDTCCQGIPGEVAGVSCCSADSNDGAPHEALSFALGYLGVKDLLSVEMTCRSLCYTVRNDPLLWRRIHIDKPLNEKITDDSLLQLTSRAQGNLYCLSLLECTKITDDGLKRVVELNSQLNKLCVPACTRLSIEGIVGIVKTFNHSKGYTGIKCLRIGGIYGVTDEHYETLKSLLDTNGSPDQKAHRPHFYVRENIYLLCDDDRAIDIQECPRCQKLRLVYDCPFEGCQFEDQTTGTCRACALCIHRCCQCGRCVDGIEYEENFWLELLCSDCKNKKPSSW